MDKQPLIAISLQKLLSGLEPGQHGVLCSPQQPEKVITQAHRVGEVYYLVGPLFYDKLPALVLEHYFQAAADALDTPAGAVAMLNSALFDCDMPAEAHVFTCTGLPNALQTLVGLFAAYR